VTRPDVVCVGSLVADVLARPIDELPERGTLGLVEQISLRGGGCALNTASALVRLGLRAAVVGKVGADPLGDYLVELLDERGVDGRGVVRDDETPTSATVVLVGSDGERTFLHLPGANAALRAVELDDDFLYAGRALHVAGALVLPSLDGEPTAAILREARRRGLVTSVGTAYDATGRWDRLLPSLPYLDLLSCALAEARAISGEREPARMATWLRAQGAAAVAVTMGADGCYAVSESFDAQVSPPPVLALDGTGSGDAFAAGLLVGGLAGWSFADAVRLANATGALATTAVGAVEGIRGLDETLAVAGIQSGP
jgi:sugar/nucleoside kinase (ribokinase family)